MTRESEKAGDLVNYLLNYRPFVRSYLLLFIATLTVQETIL